MLFSAHPEALYEHLVLSGVNPFDNVFAHSRISITNDLLVEYERRFASTTEQQLLMSFISSLGTRLKVVPLARFGQVVSLGSDLQTAANYGGKNMVLAAGHVVDGRDEGILGSLGIRWGSLPDVFDPTCQLGFSPFERFVMEQGARQSPECISRFFRGEGAVTFYDKYIGPPAISLINYVLPLLSPQCAVMVATSRNAPLGLMDIRSALRLQPHQRAIVECVDGPTSDRFHDRHIFIGRHYHLHISRGLDIFGIGPRWSNLNGEIAVYDCSDGKDIEISFLRQNGSQRTPLRLKACVVA